MQGRGEAQQGRGAHAFPAHMPGTHAPAWPDSRKLDELVQSVLGQHFDGVVGGGELLTARPHHRRQRQALLLGQFAILHQQREVAPRLKSVDGEEPSCQGLGQRTRSKASLLRSSTTQQSAPGGPRTERRREERGLLPLLTIL